MSSSEVLQLEPRSEIVGTIQDVGEVYVVIEAVNMFKIPRETFSSDQVERLRKGTDVGIFFIDDGKTKIREISPVPRDHSTVVRVTMSEQTEF